MAKELRPSRCFGITPKSPYYLKTISDEAKPSRSAGIKIHLYHIPRVWTKFLPILINVIILQAINTKNGKMSIRIIFCTDMTLAPELLLEYYCLRFQIEFNFRDAKQYFGLADFRAYKKMQVHNSVGLALFMVNLSHVIRKLLMEQLKHLDLDQLSILDLKAVCRAEKYYERILKLGNLDHKSIKKQDFILVLAKTEAINLN